MKQFNTSGPNIPEEHYTLSRSVYLQKGVSFVKDQRYFTIWAPRQTGKSTYFGQLADVLKGMGYKVAHVNFENYKNRSLESFMDRFRIAIQKGWGLDMTGKDMAQVFLSIEQINDRKMVLIIDEIEGINAEYLGDFLHSIRNAYHSRTEHGLKSVILVSSKNVVEIASEVGVAFNIAEDISLDFFNQTEVVELLNLHEQESNQKFEEDFKNKVYELTSGHPSLVNILMNQLVEKYSNEKILTNQHLKIVEEWYIHEGFEKELENKIKKTPIYRLLLERLLLRDWAIKFNIGRDDIRQLLNLGIVKRDEHKNVVISTTLYQQCLHKLFYSYPSYEK